MKKLLGTILILGIIGMVVYPFGVSGAWYDTDYAHRKSHTITGAYGAGTNYQMKIIAYKATGTDSAGVVYLGTGIQDDFDDVRFTDNDETTALDFWIASTTSGVSAEFWVEVADDLGSNRDIYIYYENSTATSASNGDNTFLFFDDFEDASINSSKWTKDIELGTITEASGYLRNGGGITTGNYGHTSLGSEVGYAGFLDNAVIWRARASTNGIGEVAFRGDYGTNAGYKARFDQRVGTNGQAFLEPPYSGWNFSNGSGTCGSDSDEPVADQWYRYEITASSTTYTLYRDGVQKRQCTDSSYTSAGEIALQNHYGSYMDTDWIAVRKFVGTEPAHSTWGSEESAPAPSGETPVPVRINNGGIRINNGGLKINP